MQTSELACIYAALICEDCSVDKSADNFVAAGTAAGIKVKPSCAKTMAKLLTKVDLADVLGNIAVGGGGGGAAAAAAPAAAKEDAKPAAAAEPAEDTDEDMGEFGLFD
ncbi:60S acidic ribosomal protein P1 [Diplonema papillatum]|nr:60S acidic ribosomal protein P1 [Diplonema papillatum]